MATGWLSLPPLVRQSGLLAKPVEKLGKAWLLILPARVSFSPGWWILEMIN